MKKFTLAVLVTNALFLMNRAYSDTDAFVDACLSSSNLDRSICECTAIKAQAELSPKAFDFLVAMLRQDDETTAKLRAEMTMEETMSAGTFMTRGPAQCAKYSGS